MQWQRVSPRLAVVESIGLVWSIGLWMLGCLVVWWLWDGRLAAVAAVAAVVVGLIRAALIVRAVSRWGYAERDEDLLVRHGVLIRHLSIVPYARMQFVDVSAGPVERAFGLATVELHTAAAASDARVPGLPGPVAARLRDRLAALGEARAEGL